MAIKVIIPAREGSKGSPPETTQPPKQVQHYKPLQQWTVLTQATQAFS